MNTACSLQEEISTIHLERLFHIKVSPKSTKCRSCSTDISLGPTDADLIAGGGNFRIMPDHTLLTETHSHTDSQCINLLKALTFAPGTPVLWQRRWRRRNRPQLVKGTNRYETLRVFPRNHRESKRTIGRSCFPKLNWPEDRHQITFELPKEPIRIGKVLAELRAKKHSTHSGVRGSKSSRPVWVKRIFYMTSNVGHFYIYAQR